MSKRIDNILYDKYVSSGQAGNTRDSVGENGLYYAEKVINNHIPENKNINLADLACGHGTYLYLLKKYGYKNIEGVDISEEQIEKAHDLGILEAKQGDIFNYLKSKNDKYFDVLLLIDIVEHFEIEDCYDLLSKVYEKLNGEGKCIIHVPNAEGIFGMRVRHGDLTHKLAFTQSSMNQLLKSIGFSKVEVIEDKPIVHGVISIFRRILWELFSAFNRLFLAAETGTFDTKMSQNILVIAHK